MLKRGLLALAVIATAVLFSGAKADAILPGNIFIVYYYYSDPAKTHLIGERWSGCGQPPGFWGTMSGYSSITNAPC